MHRHSVAYFWIYLTPVYPPPLLLRPHTKQANQDRGFPPAQSNDFGSAKWDRLRSLDFGSGTLIQPELLHWMHFNGTLCFLQMAIERSAFQCPCTT